MHHFDRQYVDVAHPQRLVLAKRMKLNLRHTRIEMFRETIGEIVSDGLHTGRIAIHGDVAQIAIRPQIVQSAHMIVVGMSEQHSINLSERQWQQLLPDIRTAVDQNARGRSLQQRRRTQTVVARILAVANRTMTSYHRHTVGCTGTQKGQLHLCHHLPFVSYSIECLLPVSIPIRTSL